MDHRDTSELNAYRVAALADLTKARALDPALEEIYYAEARIDVDPHHWAQRLAILERGIADCPAALLYAAEVGDLLRVGRMTDAVVSARNAVSLDPLSPWNREALVSALAYSGAVSAARAELDRAERLWPGSQLMRDVRYRFDLRYGDPANALRLLDTAEDPNELSGSPTVERPFLLARIQPNPAKVQVAVEAGRPGRNGTYRGLSPYLQTLGTFGRVEEAYRTMNATQATSFWGYGTFVLFRPQMRPLWLDRRFFAFAARIGLADYWIRSGHWPDFCSDPALPYDCRAEAQRLSLRLPAAPARIG
jgi:tetratricopeptide (TPR) repeat protein